LVYILLQIKILELVGLNEISPWMMLDSILGFPTVI